jgi:hypothetical protein
LTDAQKAQARDAWELRGQGGVFVPFAALDEYQQRQVYAVFMAGMREAGTEPLPILLTKKEGD